MHFVQADTLVPAPGNPMAWDRYAYVLNNPVRYTDPSGHYAFEDTPDDPYFAPAHRGINPARRYVTVGVTESEAAKIFVLKMSDPGKDIAKSDGFGGQNTLGGPGYHAAVDFRSTREEKKDTNITSVLPGKVVEVTKNRTGDFGLHVVVEHDIYGIKLYSIYAHLNKTLVTKGRTVSSGTVIGGMGNTPFEAGGAIHLHFEVRTTLNVQLDETQKYVTLMRYKESYWADTLSELRMKWVDLSQKYGYSPTFPENWK